MAKKTAFNITSSLAAKSAFVANAPAAATKAERGKMVRINFEIEPELHQRLKIHATVKGTSIRDLLLKLIDKELSQ